MPQVRFPRSSLTKCAQRSPGGRGPPLSLPAHQWGSGGFLRLAAALFGLVGLAAPHPSNLDLKAFRHNVFEHRIGELYPKASMLATLDRNWKLRFHGDIQGAPPTAFVRCGAVRAFHKRKTAASGGGTPCCSLPELRKSGLLHQPQSWLAPEACERGWPRPPGLPCDCLGRTPPRVTRMHSDTTEHTARHGVTRAIVHA